ncbi:CotH kinase family protein [bacterium]|nr:CotH kinase family protein [bacterium]
MVRRLSVLVPIIFLLNISTSHISSAQPEEPTLPVYSLIIDSTCIEYLNHHWWTSKRFPAILVIEDDSLLCHVRYRGASARNLPKKSWKVFFDDEGPDGIEELNLNSEYRDRSISRNHFCLELSRFANIPTPQTRHISFYVNGIYSGVYLEVENVDELFLRRNFLDVGAIWKAINHGAHFAPFIQREHLYLNYEPKIKPLGAVDTLLTRFAWLVYADQGAIEEGLENLVAIEEVLTYFAVQYITNNGDGFTKNYYTYENNDGRWMIFPWDCDATLGNSYRGDWIDDANIINEGFLKYNALFQRLISIPEYRERFLEIIDYLISDGFDYLVDCVEETFNEIRHDVYMDTARLGNNEDFELERVRLFGWLHNRTYYLEDLDWFNWLGVSSFSFHPEYIQSPSDTFVVSANFTEEAYRVYTYIIDSSGAQHRFALYDDGYHGDREADDLTYTANISIPHASLPFHFSIYCAPNYCEGYPSPPSGWLYYNIFPTPLPAIRLDEGSPEEHNLSFTSFYRNEVTDTQYFGLLNTTDHCINVSDCIVHVGSDHRKWQISETPLLNPDEELIITNHYDEIRALFENSLVTGDFCFPLTEIDTIRFETWGGRLITSSVVGDISNYNESVEYIVINEINYNSADNFNPDDWIELYCRRGEFDLTGWILKDQMENHEYEIPAGTRLSTDHYLVIAQNPELFEECFPDVTPVIGGYYFSFSGSGDEIRLFDNSGVLVDHVRYDDNNPWPNDADGEGPTLELINPWEANYGAENWRASDDDHPYGSPCERNSSYASVKEKTLTPTSLCLNSIYPNPANGQVTISWNQPGNVNPDLTIYDLQGRQIANLTVNKYSPGNHSVTWNAHEMPAGIYLIRFEFNNYLEIEKVALIK